MDKVKSTTSKKKYDELAEDQSAYQFCLVDERDTSFEDISTPAEGVTESLEFQEALERGLFKPVVDLDTPKTCHTCSLSFSKDMRAQVLEHIARHQAEAPPQSETSPLHCSYCSGTLPSQRTWNNHFCPWRPRVQCPHCQVKMYKIFLDTHCTPGRCAVCKEEYPCQGLLRHHRDGPEFECVTCSLKFCHEAKYLGHFEVKHQRQVQLGWKELKFKGSGFGCNKCKVYFSTEKNLSWHNSRTHVALRKACPLCDTHHNNDTKVKEHLTLMHFTEEGRRPPLPCTLCQQVFGPNPCLEKHLELLEEEKETKTPFSLVLCSFCNTIIFRDKLQAHFESRHRIDKNIMPNYAVIKVSAIGHSIKFHCRPSAMVQKRRKIYMCSDCNHQSFIKDNMVNHMVSEHLKGTFVCSLCDTSFIQLAMLKEHSSKEHNIPLLPT